MKYCKKCGHEMDDNADFCPACGTSTREDEQKNSFNFSNLADQVNNPQDDTAGMDPTDIAKNKAMGVLAYFGLLVLIPLLAAKDSKFARYHSNQGLVLMIISMASSALAALIGLIPVVGWIVAIALNVLNVALFVLMIMGIVYAAQGKAKELPVIGKIHLLK